MDIDIKKSFDSFAEKMKELKDKTGDLAEVAKDKLDDGIESVQGALEAAKENLRIASASGKSQVESSLLQIQMNVDKFKEEAKEARAQGDQAKELKAVKAAEKEAADALVIADFCADEAVYAVLEATSAKNAYESKYGPIADEDAKKQEPAKKTCAPRR